MPLKTHHKILIGGASSIIVISIIVISILLFILYTQQKASFNNLENKINELKVDTQSKFNSLTEGLLNTQKSLEENQQALSEIKASASSDFSGIIEQAVPSVVTIRTDVSQGTGFIITGDGYLVTNAHVLAGARTVAAVTSEQNLIQAKFIGYNGNLDVALLKIQGSYNEIQLANSDNVQVGEKVIAICNPLGLQFSVSEGIVSAINREGSNGLPYYIQTDAALNP